MGKTKISKLLIWLISFTWFLRKIKFWTTRIFTILGLHIKILTKLKKRNSLKVGSFPFLFILFTWWFSTIFKILTKSLSSNTWRIKKHMNSVQLIKKALYMRTSLVFSIFIHKMENITKSMLTRALLMWFQDQKHNKIIYWEKYSTI